MTEHEMCVLNIKSHHVDDTYTDHFQARKKCGIS